jgi:hypothetical protein
MRKIQIAAMVMIAGLTAGCAEDLDVSNFPAPAGLTSRDGGTSGADGGGGACNVTTIFAAHACIACHDAVGSFGGFDMASVGWETRLVGVAPKGGGASRPSVCASGGGSYLVAGSAPATGLFLDKLKGTTATSCGEGMPVGLEALGPTELACVQQWANRLTAP